MVIKEKSEWNTADTALRINIRAASGFPVAGGFPGNG